MVVIERDCEAASEVITVGGYRLSDDHSELEPPDPIPNSVVKRLSADGSLGFPHVRVGHRQALIPKKARPFKGRAFFYHGSPLRHGADPASLVKSWDVVAKLPALLGS